MLRKRVFVYLILLALIVASCGGGPSTPAPKKTGSVSGLLVAAGTVGKNSNQNFEIVTSQATILNTSPDFEAIPGEYLVKFKDGISTQGLESLTVAGSELRQISSMSFNDLTIYFYKAKSVSKLQSASIANDLANNPNIDAIVENRMYDMTKTPNDPIYPAQWHYPSFNLPAAWDIETGKSIVVAVVDSGIVKHPELRILPGYDFYANDNDPTDEAGAQTQFHGTHVAGTIAAKSNDKIGATGVSWQTSIVPVRVLGPRGSTETIMKGTFWAAGGTINGVADNPNPAKIINLSLGGKGACSKLENDVFKNLTDAGRIVVVAAGNDNVNVNDFSPANCENVITVGATGPKGQRAPYSNYGNLIDIMAPGGDVSQSITFGNRNFPAGVLSTSFDLQSGKFSYSFLQGTSMAAPHISGLLALMVSKNPNLKYADALAKLKAASRAMSATDCKRGSGSDCGAGLVDAAKALGASGTNPPPKPPPTTNITTYVFALYCKPDTNCQLYDIDRSKYSVVKQDKSSVPYKLSGLEKGKYFMLGYQDLNGNVEFDKGEPAGAYPSFIDLAEGENILGATIKMQPLTTNSTSSSNKSLREIINNVNKEFAKLKDN